MRFLVIAGTLVAALSFAACNDPSTTPDELRRKVSYVTDVTLPDGRRLECVVMNNGGENSATMGLDCNWPEPTHVTTTTRTPIPGYSG